MTKEKRFPLFALPGIFKGGVSSKVKIETQPIAPKRESFMISEQKIKRMKGKKARKNRGKRRRK